MIRSSSHKISYKSVHGLWSIYSEISGVHWDNISGGVHRRQAGYSLYGYIDYDLAYEFGLCSGRHSYYREDAKICIPNSCNKGDYRKGYLELKRDAGEKPKANYRKPRQKPCTQQVCLLLSEVPYFFRKDLRQRLKEMEYTVNIARALKRLIEQGKIRTEGSANSPKQRIYLAK